MQRDNASGTGYEPRSVQLATANSSLRPDLRWGRLSFAQFRDEEFLAKQLRRIEITQGARRAGRSAHAEAVTLTGLAPDKTIRQRLVAAQTKAARGASEDEELDSKAETLATEVTVKTDDEHERELTNALCVLGDLQQPELATLMATTLKDALGRGCTFPNPVYQLIALRRQLVKSMHEAVAAQHRQRKTAVQVNAAIAKCLETSQVSVEAAQSLPDVVGALTTIKPKEKVAREASMGIHVLISFLSDLHDPAVSTLSQRREFLEDLLPLLRSMGFLSLSPRTNSSGAPLTARGVSSRTTDIAEFTEKIQRFLLDMCPRYTSIPSSSPKLPAISSGSSECDVLDRTNAVNGLIHLAAATGSLTAKEAGVTRPDSSKPQKGGPLSKRETEILGDGAVQDTLRRKALPKGMKAIGASTNGVVTARCPKFKALSIQSVLVELNQAKPAAITRASRGKPSSSLPTANAGGFSNDASAFAGDDDEGDREAWSCGQNSYGELGHGDTASRKSFERIESLQQKEIVQIGAGNEHTIALTADGKVLTCGYNDNGQCGQGGTARVSHLSEVPKLGENSISQVHAYNGCEHTILVTMEGRAATCGYNYRGQLGHGNTASESVPKVVRSLENRIVRLVSCSYYHTVMACEEDGSGQQFLYTFGRNDYGQLGHNDSIDRKVPQHVEALNDQHIVSVACGQYHTMVVTATGKAFAFGKNDYGQLGVDSMENQLVPVQVRAGLEKQECLEIRCGYYHTIALCSGAHLFGFGRNDYGQLGLGRSGASLAANLQLQQQRFSYARLIEELEGKDIVRFACGCYHTVAVSDNGVMYVFGRNNHGQLGTGDTNERLYPFPIDDFVGKRVALVAAGFYHTVVLTGGKDDEKNDQDAAGNDKGEASTAPVSTGDALFVATVILAQLERLCQPFIPKPGSYPTLHHPPVGVVESLVANTATSSFDLLRSGMAKAVILLSTGMKARKPPVKDAKAWATELDRMRAAMLQSSGQVAQQENQGECVSSVTELYQLLLERIAADFARRLGEVVAARPSSADKVPVAWRSYIEFAMAAMGQCCEVLGQFSNNALFAAALLPTLKTLLRLLDGFNRRDAGVEDAEKLFVDSVASSVGPRPPQKENGGSFRCKSDGNLLSLGSARDADGKTTGRKGLTTSEAMALPWHYRLEKELAVLAAEMAVTLVIGDPFFTYGQDDALGSGKLFLASLQRAPDPLVGGAATKLCEWVRDSYAKKDPSYRMIVRQSQLSMNLKTPANAIDRQCVSQLRRRVAAKKTEIKSTPTEAAESPRMSAQDRIVAFQQTILDRCKLLLLVDVHEEQEHLNLQLDAGYIAPYDPAFLVSASSAFKLSAPSAKRHLHATYTDDKLPFLTAFPLSKWRKNVGYFYSSLQSETFSEFLGRLTAMMTDKAVLLMEPGEADTTATFWIVIVLLSAWGIHFKADQFEFLVFMRGAAREVSLYLVLVPESIDNWQLEVGILMDLNREADGGVREFAVKGRIWERVLSKQAVAGGKWIHVAVVLEATKIRLYLN
uniref:RCC1-like domain-containing protein n=1 Tax=Phytophthora ramorum TaxID=164328 RepID=H3HD12_PHYRM